MITVALHAIDFHYESAGLFDPRILSALKRAGYTSDFSQALSLFKKPSLFFSSSNRHPLRRDLHVWGERVRFDVPLDFSGIAKGYILDILARRLRNDGWQNFLIDAGGDIVLSGVNVQNEYWRIDVEGVSPASILAVRDMEIATSGITRRQWIDTEGNRYHHLIHPKHPLEFSFDLLSVTALSENAERSDFLAKILFLMGREVGQAFATKHRIPAIFLEERNGRTVLFKTPETTRLLCKTQKS